MIYWSNHLFFLLILYLFSAYEAGKVKINGRGVQPVGIRNEDQVSFDIDVTEAGVAELKVYLYDPSRLKIKRFISGLITR